MGNYQQNPRIVGTRGLIAMARQLGLGLGLAGGFRILEPTTGNMGVLDSANVAARATGHGAYDKNAYKTGYSTIGAFDFEVTGEILPFLLRMMYGNAESRNVVNAGGLPGFEHLVQMDENEQFDSDYMTLVQSTGRSRGWRNSGIYTRHILRHIPTYTRLFGGYDFNVDVYDITNNVKPHISSLPTSTTAYSGGFVVENIGTPAQITAIAERQYDKTNIDTYGFEPSLWRSVAVSTTAPGPMIKAGRTASTKQLSDTTYFVDDVPVDSRQVVAILDGQLKREFWRFPGTDSPTVWPVAAVKSDDNAKSLALIYDYELVSAVVDGDNSVVAVAAANVDRIERVYATNLPDASVSGAPLAATDLYLIVPAANTDYVAIAAASDKEWVKNGINPTSILIKGGSKSGAYDALNQSTNKVLVVYKSVLLDVRTYNPYSADDVKSKTDAYTCRLDITPLYNPVVFDPSPITSRDRLDLHVVYQYPWQSSDKWKEIDLTDPTADGNNQTIWDRLDIARSNNSKRLEIIDFDELLDGDASTPGEKWIGLNTKVLFDYQATQTSLYPQEIFLDCKPGRLSIMVQPGSSVRASVSIQGRVSERLDSLDNPIGPRAKEALLYPFEFERTSGFPMTVQTNTSNLAITFENGHTLGTTNSLDTGQSEAEIGSENLIIKKMSIECGNVLTDPEDRAVGLQVQPSIELLRRAASISAEVEMTSATYYDMLYYGLGRDRGLNDHRWNDDVLLGGMSLSFGNARPFASVIGVEMPRSYFSGYIIERVPDRLVRAQIQITALRHTVSPSDTVKWRIQTPIAIEEAY